MHEALRSDRAAYKFATGEGEEWLNPQADVHQAQEALDGMSNEQQAVIRVLAHRQTHVALHMMGVRNIDPESEAYLQQYNIIAMSIIGGNMLQSQEDAHVNSQAQSQDNASESFDDQLKNAASQFGQPQTGPRPCLFDFSGGSCNQSRSQTPAMLSG